MAKRSEKRKIDGYDVTITQFEPMTALELAPRVGKVLAPALPILMASKDKREALARNAPGAVAEVFEKFCEHMIAAGPKTISDLLACAVVVLPRQEADGSDGPMQVHELTSPALVNVAFGGRLDLLYKVAYACVEVNFFRYFFASASPEASPGTVSP